MTWKPVFGIFIAVIVSSCAASPTPHDPSTYLHSFRASTQEDRRTFYDAAIANENTEWADQGLTLLTKAKEHLEDDYVALLKLHLKDSKTLLATRDAARYINRYGVTGVLYSEVAPSRTQLLQKARFNGEQYVTEFMKNDHQTYYNTFDYLGWVNTLSNGDVSDVFLAFIETSRNESRDQRIMSLTKIYNEKAHPSGMNYTKIQRFNDESFKVLEAQEALEVREKAIEKAAFEKDHEAVPINRNTPEIPKAFYRLDKSGHCLVEYDINKHGRIENLEAKYCTDKILEQPSLTSAREWTYEPAVVNYQPVHRYGVQNKIHFIVSDSLGRRYPEKPTQ